MNIKSDIEAFQQKAFFSKPWLESSENPKQLFMLMEAPISAFIINFNEANMKAVH